MYGDSIRQVIQTIYIFLNYGKKQYNRQNYSFFESGRLQKQPYIHKTYLTLLDFYFYFFQRVSRFLKPICFDELHIIILITIFFINGLFMSINIRSPDVFILQKKETYICSFILYQFYSEHFITKAIPLVMAHTRTMDILASPGGTQCNKSQSN